MWFCVRNSQTCLIKWCILTNFGNLHISLKLKDVLPKKKLSKKTMVFLLFIYLFTFFYFIIGNMFKNYLFCNLFH